MHTILVIDDETDVRDSIKRVLERAGFEVHVADNAETGLAKLEKLAVDIIITDIIMPEVNGVDAIGRIIRDFPRVRILAISGGGNFDVVGYQPTAITTTAYLAAASKAGAHGILTKPFDSTELIKAVKAVIGAGHA